MKILVTGGGGFLGSAVVRQLLARGEVVRSLARGAYPELEKMGVEVRRGDIADQKTVFSAIEGCDAVIHVAAKAGIWGSYNDYYRPNVIGTQHVISACQHHGIQKLVYTSSPSVVDAGKPIENGDESLPYPTKYESYYSETKALGEQLILKANNPTLATVAICPPLIWGPGDHQITPRLMERAAKGRIFKIGRRPCVLDTTYIDNAAEAHLLALDRLAPGSPIAGKTYFVSNGEPLPAEVIISKIIDTKGYPPIQRTVPYWLPYAAGWAAEWVYRGLGIKNEPPLTRFLVRQLAKSRWFNISAARRDLGYSPNISIDEGLQILRESWRRGGLP